MMDAMAEEGRHKFSALQRKAREAVPAARDYARSHPWMLTAAGAAALGGVVFAVMQGSRSPSRADQMRAWLEEAASHLPRPKRSLLDRLLGRKRGFFA